MKMLIVVDLSNTITYRKYFSVPVATSGGDSGFICGSGSVHIVRGGYRAHQTAGARNYRKTHLLGDANTVQSQACAFP